MDTTIQLSSNPGISRVAKKIGRSSRLGTLILPTASVRRSPGSNSQQGNIHRLHARPARPRQVGCPRRSQTAGGPKNRRHRGAARQPCPGDRCQKDDTDHACCSHRNGAHPTRGTYTIGIGTSQERTQDTGASVEDHAIAARQNHSAVWRGLERQHTGEAVRSISPTSSSL